jgi:tetratricopeptide (TPR) repeat protein
MSSLRSRWARAVLVSATLSGVGCGGNVARGHTLYNGGYYIEAAEVFERNERRLSEWPPDKRAAYGLYRGMTLLQLGDLHGARRWLAYARWVASEHPGALQRSEIALLDQGQHNLDLRLGRPPGAPPVPVLVTAEPNALPPVRHEPSAPGGTTPTAPHPSRRSFAQ